MSSPSDEQLDELARLLIPRLNAIADKVTELEGPARCPVPKCSRYATRTVQFRLPEDVREITVCYTHKEDMEIAAVLRGRAVQLEGRRIQIALSVTEYRELRRSWSL